MLTRRARVFDLRRLVDLTTLLAYARPRAQAHPKSPQQRPCSKTEMVARPCVPRVQARAEHIAKVPMGARLELSPHLLSLMSAEDQARYGGATDTTIIVDKTPTTSRRDADERREQATFANWL